MQTTLRTMVFLGGALSLFGCSAGPVEEAKGSGVQRFESEGAGAGERAGEADDDAADRTGPNEQDQQNRETPLTGQTEDNERDPSASQTGQGAPPKPPYSECKTCWDRCQAAFDRCWTNKCSAGFEACMNHCPWC
jgi:hypothetical protein